MLARLAFVLAALAASSAWAQGYIGGSMVRAIYGNACEGAAAGITCESGDTGIRLFSGYSFTPNFAVEFGYGTFGTLRANTGEAVDLSAADLSLIGTWPISNRFSAHGRLGVYAGTMETAHGSIAVANTDNTCPAPPPGGALPPCPQPASPPERGWQSGNHTDITYGLGLSYAMTQTAELRVEWQRFQNFGGGDLNVDLLSIGALVRFQ